MVTFSDSMQMLDLELFDAAFAVAPGTEADVRRRFMTLFVHDSDRRHGGSAEVCRATNTRGEAFAIKRLRTAEGTAPTVPDQALPMRKELRHSVDSSGSASAPTPDYVTQGHVSAFYEEYRVQLAVSRLRGFPRLYGFALASGQPIIVMEWVEGVTLREAIRSRAQDGPLPLATIARLGLAVLELLQRAAGLSERFVHRDLSPRNIMLRTDRTTAAEQLSTGDFDLCLVDFGSAALRADEPDEQGFTQRTNVWRMGTPAYAPPEMLTSDVAFPEGWRQSPAIDVYALCSVLFELYAGEPPFDLSARGELTPYRVKTETAPRALEAREGDGGGLAAAICAGLSTDQQERPTIPQLRSALENWLVLPTRHVAVPGPARPAEAALWQPGHATRLVTRRRVVSGALVGASALASLAIVTRARRGRTEPPLDESRYPRAEALYAGDPLYLGFDGSLGGWALYDAVGAVVCKPASSRPCGALREGLVALFDDINQRYGYITPTGAGDGYAWAILPRLAQAADFAEGLAAAQDAQTGLWGYVDATGTWAISPQFAEAAAFSHGAAAVRPPDQALWGAIGTDGGWLIDPTLPALGMRASDGCAAAQDVAGLWGIVDELGDWVSDVRHVRLRRYAHGFAPAFDPERGLWGLVDAHGSWAVAPAFADLRPLYQPFEGSDAPLAAAQDAGTRLWHFVGADGTADGSPRLWKLGDLRDGLAPAQASAEDDTVVFDPSDPDSSASGVGMRYGYVDAAGTWQMRRLVTLTDTRIGAAEV